MLHPGAIFENGSVFSLDRMAGNCLHLGDMLGNLKSLEKYGTSDQSGTMIIKEKTAPLLKSGAVFQNSSRVEPFWLHFFFSVLSVWFQLMVWA